MRLILITIFITLFFMISSNADEYYCPYGDGSFDINRDIYYTEDGCKHWDTDFWRECDPDIYLNCVKNQLALRRKYFEGKCESMVDKTHTLNNSTCTVKYAPKSKKYISIACKGATKEFRNQVKAMYK